MRPRESKVTEAQSAAWRVDVTLMPRPSGPGTAYESVWNASSWMLLRPFGASLRSRHTQFAIFYPKHHFGLWLKVKRALAMVGMKPRSHSR